MNKKQMLRNSALNSIYSFLSLEILKLLFYRLLPLQSGLIALNGNGIDTELGRVHSSSRFLQGAETGTACVHNTKMLLPLNLAGGDGPRFKRTLVRKNETRSTRTIKRFRIDQRKCHRIT